MTSKKGIIGRAEFVEFPDYEISVPAKVDTGADRNSVHATRIKIIEKDGEEILRCRILKGPYLEFKDFDTVHVKSSNGETQKRFKVKLLVSVLGKKYKTSFSLTNRQKMKYPILLGKNFLRNRFLVDVSLKNISLNL
jgi:hypothetical protein